MFHQLTFSVCDAGLVQYRERLPVKVIVGACVGGGLFLIIFLCVSVVVLYKRKTSTQSHQQQALPRQPQPQPRQQQRRRRYMRNQQQALLQQPQPQPRQQQRTHTYGRYGAEQGYINDHMAPNYGIPFNPMAHNGKYFQAVPDRGIPMGQMTDAWWQLLEWPHGCKERNSLQNSK